MKILCVSDTHEHRVRDLPEADVLIHAGDWSSYGAERETTAFLTWLDDIEHKFLDIVVCPGNHDRWPFAQPDVVRKMFEDRGFHYLEDRGATIQGKKFYGMPWTPVFGRWAFMTDMAGRKARCAAIPDDTEVLITHGPPHKIMDGVPHFNTKTQEIDLLHAGCMELRDRVLAIKPKLHVFGHIHEGSGELHQGGTHFVNASIMDEYYRPVNKYRLVEIA